MKEIKLKPCPFCGGIPKIDESYRQWDGTYYLSTSIVCEVCGASSKEVWDIKTKDRNERINEVIEKWNRRKEQNDNYYVVNH